MKLTWKLLLAALVIGLLLPFTLLKDDSGSTLLKFSNLRWPDWDRAVKNLPQAIESSDQGAEGGIKFYRWVGAEGNQQFSNSPPPEGVDYSVKIYDPNMNVIQSVKVEKNDQEVEATAEAESEKEASTNENTGSPYSVDGIKKLFEDVNNIEKLLNQRHQKQETLLSQ